MERELVAAPSQGTSHQLLCDPESGTEPKSGGCTDNESTAGAAHGEKRD